MLHTFSRPHFYSMIILGLTLLGLLGVLSNFSQIQTWVSKASGEPANLIIDTKGILGLLPKPWQYLAQGGESPSYRFNPVQSQLQAVNPQYVRLDHIFDFYDVVAKRPDGSLDFSWKKLDTMLQDIANAGAKPYLSLSYMPLAISSGDLTAPPQQWEDWAYVVQRLIEHVSGLSGLNLTDVYYEVWNEPDLFGGWKTYGSKNYLTLYEFAAKGAAAAQNVQPFRFGGPATTKLYDNWVTRFVNYVVDNNLRFDFFSWHHYTKNPQEYLADYERYVALMRAYPDLILKVEPIISEWGFSPEVHPGYDSSFAAAHTAAVYTTLIPKINKMFLFEFQDGKDPAGQEYWGKWGLLTHQDFGSHEKPRYTVLRLFNRLGPLQLSLVGQGTWVKGLAAQSPEGYVQLLLSNYDPASTHVETVPLTFQRVKPGNYLLLQEFMNRLPRTVSLNTQTSTLTHQLTIPPNDIVFLELKPQ